MNRDTAVGIVGSVLLVAAMVGVFVYEYDNVQPGEGEEELGDFVAEGPRLSGTVAVGASDSQVANVTEPRATNLTFRLTWAAENGRDTLRITVTPPPGVTATGMLTEMGDEGTAQAIAQLPAGSGSSGEWTVTVDFVSAEPDPLPGGVQPPVPPPNSTDDEVGYTVAVTLA